MPQDSVRDLAPKELEYLKSRARLGGRSLQGEPKVLESAAQVSVDEALATSERWRRRLAGQMTSDSADLLREDRDR